MPQLVCIAGAECTGKTTLARSLALHFSGVWVPEYLREFCAARQRPPRSDEQLQILQAQHEREEAALAQARHEACPLVFCDTPALLIAIYSVHYFADPTLLEPAHALHTRYALTLLLAPDLPWVADGVQRDGAGMQAAVHALLHSELDRSYPVVCIAGRGLARLQATIDAVQRLTCQPLESTLHRGCPLQDGLRHTPLT